MEERRKMMKVLRRRSADGSQALGRGRDMVLGGRRRRRAGGLPDPGTLRTKFSAQVQSTGTGVM